MPLVIIIVVIFGFIFFITKGDNETVGETLEVIAGERAWSCDATAHYIIKKQLAKMTGREEKNVSKSDYDLLSIETIHQSKEVSGCEIKVKFSGEKYLISYTVLRSKEFVAFETLSSTINKIDEEK